MGIDVATLIASTSKKSSTDFNNFLNNIDVDYEYDADTNANYTIIRIYRNKLDGHKQYPFVYASNGINSGNKSTYDMNTSEGFFLAINAGIFNTSTRVPDGLLVQNGNILQIAPSSTHSKCRPLLIDKDGNLSEGNYNISTTDLISQNIISGVCGFMAIVKDYKAIQNSDWNSVDHYTQNAQRQILGQFGNGDYAILTCEGRNFQNSDGWTIEEAQKICIKHGLKFAYNLDGGGSTETMIGRKHLNTVYENTTGRIVPTFIVFNGTDDFSKTVPKSDIQIISFIKGLTTIANTDNSLNISANSNRCTCLSLNNNQRPDSIIRNGNNSYYLINVPEDATSVTVKCPEYYVGIAFWNYDEISSKYKRILDPGWSKTMGEYTITFEASKYSCFSANFKNSSNSTISDIDTSDWSIEFK